MKTYMYMHMYMLMYVNDTYCHQTPKPMGGIQHNTHTTSNSCILSFFSFVSDMDTKATKERLNVSELLLKPFPLPTWAARCCCCCSAGCCRLPCSLPASASASAS